ncbi:MAG: NADPH-dependent FMN reductase [Atopobiaceae bacterium]
MAQKNVLLVIGTLRKDGFNKQLAERVQQLLDGRASVSVLDYSKLPLMNQDLENPEQPEVAAVREQVRNADGVWFVSPQYNASFPGHVKNLVDWLSRPLPGQGRDTAVSGGMKATVSGAGGRTATAEMRAALDSLLEFVGAKVMREPETGIALSGESWGTGTLTLSAEDEAALAAQADAFLKFIA